ncbi:MFS transporter [Rhodococcus opacus]|nr:MFS transporter [Rhodococcus opacus]
MFMLINFADKAVLGLAAGPIMEHIGLTSSQYGLIASGFFLLFSVAAIVGGVVSDRVPSKWLLVGMAVVWSIAQLPMLAPLGAYGFWVVLGSRVLLGAAEGPAYPVANHAAHKWFPDRERDLVSGILTIGAPLGVVLAAPGLTWIISTFGWRAAFVTMSVFGLIWVAVWIRFGKDSPARSWKLRGQDATAADGGSRTAGALPDDLGYPDMDRFSPRRLRWVLGTGNHDRLDPDLFLKSSGLQWLCDGMAGRDPVGLYGGVDDCPGDAESLVDEPRCLEPDYPGSCDQCRPPAVRCPRLRIIGRRTCVVEDRPAQPGAGNVRRGGADRAGTVLRDQPAGAQRRCPRSLRGRVFSGGNHFPGTDRPVLDSAGSVTDGFTQAFILCGIILIAAGLIAGLLIHPQSDHNRLAKRAEKRSLQRKDASALVLEDR